LNEFNFTKLNKLLQHETNNKSQAGKLEEKYDTSTSAHNVNSELIYASGTDRIIKKEQDEYLT